MNQHPLEQFLAACGSNEPLRIGVGTNDEMKSTTKTLSQPFVVIGRRADSDMIIDHWKVSRRHAYLQLIDGRYYCVDVGSRTGTHGGDATRRSGWLEEGRTIQIGPFNVRPHWPTRVIREPRQLPGLTWEIPGQSGGKSLWKMERSLVLIGRSQACRIRMIEAEVSKFHCSLVLTTMGVWVVDLLSQKGTFVNDESIRCVRLNDGDELRVGNHILVPRYDRSLPELEIPDPSTDSSEELSTTDQLPARRTTVFPMPLPMPSQTGWPDPGSGPSQEITAFLEQPPGVIDPTVTALVQQFGMMQQHMFDQFHQTMMMMFEGFATLHRESSDNLRDEFDEVRKLSQEIESLRVETARLAEATAAKAKEQPRPTINGHGAIERPVLPEKPVYQPITKPTAPVPDPEVDIHAQLCLRLASIQTERQNRWQKILGMMSTRS